jgi:pilus assembly protein Flp/PilA
MSNLLKKFWACESGATAIEYALIAGLVSVLIVAGATKMGTAVSAKFNAAANGLT